MKKHNSLDALVDRANWFAVYDGQRRIGHFISRGRQGFEAYDADERSLGLYGTQRAAFKAISTAHDHTISRPRAITAAASADRERRRARR
jgi:hypothetical protein